MCSCKKSYNLLVSIPSLSYKSQHKTHSVDIENIPVYFLNTS